MPNPFFYGGRVDPEQFVGRQVELRTIFNLLETAHTGQMQSISVVGPHRMGRSSLLFYIAACYGSYLKDPKAYRVVYISLHDPECHDPGLLLQKILRELGVATSTGESIDLLAFQKALELLKGMGICPVVCLDEFEELIQTGAFENTFFDAWRNLMSNSAIAFVIASTRPLDDLVRADKYTSSFFNIFTLLELGEFAPAEAELLIQRGQTCDHSFTAEEARQMRALGGRHPYKLQVAGEKIYIAKSTGVVDWKQIRHGVEAQLRQAGLGPKPVAWPALAWRKLLAFIRSIGAAVLAIRPGSGPVSDSTALWWGIIVVVGVLLVLLDVIPWGYIVKGIQAWLGK